MANENLPKKKRGGEVFWTLFVLLLVIGVGLYYGTTPPVNHGKLVGQPAPEISYKTSTGQSTSVHKLEKVALLNFWATWCGPCLQEMPSLKMLEDHFAGKGFVLLAFDIEEGDGDIRGQITGLPSGLETPQNLIFNFSRSSLTAYDIQYIPLSVLIDRNGIVRHVYNGPQKWMDVSVLKEIEALLN